MNFEPVNDRRLLRKFERTVASSPTLPKPPSPPSGSAPATSPAGRLLSDVPSTPLTWLWPSRVPFGHLTLLDAAPDCGLSLFALTLAACVSSGSPLPDGTPVQQGNVLLFAPYDAAADTINPRLQAAGGDLAHIMILRPLLEDTAHTPPRARPFQLPHDLNHLGATIRSLRPRLLILDPASAIPGLSRSLPALLGLAQQNHCAILLTRALRRSPADPLHAPGPSSLLLEAARSRLFLAPDPADASRCLLLTTRHPLCAQPSILAYDIHSSKASIPLIRWLGESDLSHLLRLGTGPIRSPHRQAILHFLQHSDSPHGTLEILKATCYDSAPGRKMIFRMRVAGELVLLARGLYTTATHPRLAQFTDDTSPSTVPNVPTDSGISSPTLPTVPNVPNLPSAQSPTRDDSSPCAVPPIPTAPIPDPLTNILSTDPNVPNPAHGMNRVAPQQIDAS